MTVWVRWQNSTHPEDTDNIAGEGEDEMPAADAKSDQTLGKVLADRANRFGDKPFIVTDSSSHTYAEIERWSNRLAHGLASLGLTMGETVLVMLPNTIDFIALWCGLGKLGAIEPRHAGHERGGSFALGRADQTVAARHAGHERDGSIALAQDADLLLHIVDGSTPHVEVDLEAVSSTLERIDVADKPQLLLFNKVDLLPEEREIDIRYLLDRHADSMRISALEDIGITGAGSLTERVLELAT